MSILKQRASNFIVLTCIALLLGCAQPFPRPNQLALDNPAGPEIFNLTFNAHGGAHLDELRDVNVGIDGDWKFLITRIQPLVTDHRYRVTSQERLLPHEGIYAAYYSGPKGTKKVARSRNNVKVFYSGEENLNDDVLQSTALTADSFFIFLLGPLGLKDHASTFVRLPDAVEKDRHYYRIYAELKPGIGQSIRDEIVLWVDKETLLTYRVHITLEGFETTKGAHVDVSFLAYETREHFTFPSKFHERVIGPIFIDAHSWHLTGLDINRGLEWQDLDKYEWSGAAKANAEVLN